MAGTGPGASTRWRPWTEATRWRPWTEAARWRPWTEAARWRPWTEAARWRPWTEAARPVQGPGLARRLLLAAAVALATLTDSAAADSAVAGSAVADAAAAGAPALEAEFDARLLSSEEKRLLQLGLVVEGRYVGLIDGLWGGASQAGIEGFAAADPGRRPVDLVRGHHAARLAAAALAFARAHGLAYRGSGPGGHRMLLPPEPFLPDPATDLHDLVLTASGVEIRTIDGTGDFAAVLHDALAAPLTPLDAPYILRRADRAVTAWTAGGLSSYVRSDRGAGRLWHSTLVHEHPGADRRLFDAMVASITLDPAAGILAPGGQLARLIEAAAAPPDMAAAAAPDMAGKVSPASAAPEMPAGLAAPGKAPPAALPETLPEAARLAPRGLPAPGLAPLSSGTAFFVTPAALVTARHVVEGCARITLADGTPLVLVARHPALDLALLAAPERAGQRPPGRGEGDWIAVGGARPARLGQRILALGYPFFGTYGTSLTVTGGNVSALSGLGDEPRELTISAPVQPGNSGGPLLGLDGAVIGVVIARLDHLAVAEMTGSLPENVNYAVAGTELVTFLEREGIALPAPSTAPADLDHGIPDPLARAVVPVLCQ